jgi:phage tail tape-measure protein
MSNIIAGRFDQIDQVKSALNALSQAGFGAGDFAGYYVAPPGQHGLYPIGGDAYSDEGARKLGRGAAVGATVGAAAGAVVGSLGGPPGALAGAGVGAYVGSLAGALNKSERGNENEATPQHPAERPGGPMVAVRADDPEAEERAVRILDQHGAHEIERAKGEWRDGEWQDFDPRLPTETLKRVSGEGRRSAPEGERDHAEDPASLPPNSH